MTRTVKSQSERDGEDLTQVSGSPHVPQPSDQNPLTEAREGRRTIGFMCPTCGTRLEQRMYGWHCPRPGCRTLLGDEWSGRPSPDKTAPVYVCVGCGGETADRYVGFGVRVPLCAKCELGRVVAQCEASLRKPEVLESVKEGLRRFLEDAQIPSQEVA